MTQAIDLISRDDAEDVKTRRDIPKRGLIFPEPAPLSSISDEIAALESAEDSFHDSGVDVDLIWKEVEEELKILNGGSLQTTEGILGNLEKNVFEGRKESLR